MSLVVAWSCYLLGDAVSRPMMWFDWGWIYPVYNRLMRMSYDHDHRRVVWKYPESTGDRPEADA